MNSDKSKEVTLPANLKFQLDKFQKLKEAADLHRKEVQNKQQDVDKDLSKDKSSK